MGVRASYDSETRLWVRHEYSQSVPHYRRHTWTIYDQFPRPGWFRPDPIAEVYTKHAVAVLVGPANAWMRKERAA